MNRLIYFGLVGVFLFLNCNLKSEPPLLFPASNSPFSVGNHPADVALGDVNGDVKSDIVTVNYNGKNISVLLGDGKGNFTPVKNSLALDSTAHLVVMGDLNNDKNPDLLISHHDSYGVTVLL